jgi:hypothetical protein
MPFFLLICIQLMLMPMAFAQTSVPLDEGAEIFENLCAHRDGRSREGTTRSVSCPIPQTCNHPLCGRVAFGSQSQQATGFLGYFGG